MLKRTRTAALVVALSVVGAACDGGSDDDSGAGDATDGGAASDVDIDYEAIGLWDDGPCDEQRSPLVIGLMTVFESPVLSLADQALALEAAAEAFNARGGANGACIEVHTCDDESTLDQSLACVREIDEAGVVATVNDTGTAGQAEVAAAMSDAGIPRIATNVTPSDWADPNVFPLDASGTGGTFLGPQALVEAGVTDIALVRVDQAAASALVGFLEDVYADEGVTFPVDVPVPAGTTDFSQFILAAEDGGAGGIFLALGEQEASQVIRAGEQLSTDLLLGIAAPSYASVEELGDFAEQLVMYSPFPPATVDLPVYEALRNDLAVSGDELLQPENLKIPAMRSWIGLYATLRMIRDSGMEEFSRDGITSMLLQAVDVPMLDIFGGEDWTPDLTRPGVFARAGIDRVAVYRWDPDADAAGSEGNFVEEAVISFDETLCGSPVGAPEPC